MLRRPLKHLRIHDVLIYQKQHMGQDVFLSSVLANRVLLMLGRREAYPLYDAISSESERTVKYTVVKLKATTTQGHRRICDRLICGQ